MTRVESDIAAMHALVGTRTLRFFARERRRVSLGEAFPSDTPARPGARPRRDVVRGEHARHLATAASRRVAYDVERPHPRRSPPLRGVTGRRNHAPRSGATHRARPRGARPSRGRPPRARALVRGNLDALETVMRRAEAQTALQRGDVRAISAGGSASGGSDAALSVARAGDHLDARGWRWRTPCAAPSTPR